MSQNYPSTQIIDFTKQVSEIQEKHGERYHFQPEYYAELRELWGFSGSNEHGVLTNSLTELIVEIGQCKGEIRFAESQKGYWLIGVCAQTSISGSSYAPSVSSGIGYASHEDARTAGILRLMRFFESEAKTKNSCSSHINKHNAREATNHLQSLLDQPQLSLF